MIEIRPLSYDETMSVPGMINPLPGSMLAIGGVDEKGEVVAAIGCYFVVHADPLWIREDHRHGGKLLIKLIESAKTAVRDTRMGSEVFVAMTPETPEPETQKVVEKIWRHVGGKEVDARFFVIPLEE